MLKFRTTDEFEAVSIHDPAVTCLQMAVLREYFDTRDITVLDKGGMNRGDATVFTCKPLIAELDMLADGDTIGNARMVFSAHVIGVSNSPVPVTTTNVQGRAQLAESYVTGWAPEIVREIANVIREWPCRGGTSSPFSGPTPQDGDWQRLVLRRQWRDALTAPPSTTSSDA